MRVQQGVGMTSEERQELRKTLEWMSKWEKEDGHPSYEAKVAQKVVAEFERIEREWNEERAESLKAYTKLHEQYRELLAMVQVEHNKEVELRQAV